MSIANMKVTEFKDLARERGLKRYSKLRKAELINLLNGDAPVVSRPIQAPRTAVPILPIFARFCIMQRWPFIGGHMSSSWLPLNTRSQRVLTAPTFALLATGLRGTGVSPPLLRAPGRGPSGSW